MKDITGLEKRSLASKYLHFHFPKLFFIYDSRVAGVLKRKLGESYQAIVNSPGVDQVYASFFCKALDERNSIEGRVKKTISPRAFDCILIHLANERLKHTAPRRGG